jgi:hypothetical protein
MKIHSWKSVWDIPDPKEKAEGWDEYFKEWKEFPRQDEWTLPKQNDWPPLKDPFSPYERTDPWSQDEVTKKKWEMEELVRQLEKSKKATDEEKKALFKEFVKAVEELQQTGNLHQFLQKFIRLSNKAQNISAPIEKWVEDLLPEDKLRDFIMMSAFGRKKGDKNV